MEQVTLKEVLEVANLSRDALFRDARQIGQTAPTVYLHWTAGHYFQLFDDYHVNIVGDGRIYMPPGDLATRRSHTWMRNIGGVAIALCGCFEANTNTLGDEKPTNLQIEAMAQVIATICDGLWLTINKENVLTHGEAAANEDGYNSHLKYAAWCDEYGDGNVRWDLEYLGTDESPVYNPWGYSGRGGDILRGKANYYRELWKQSTTRER